MRLQAVRVPDPRHAGMADSLPFRHCPRAPVGRIFRLRVQGGFYDRIDFLGRQSLDAQAMGGVLRQARRACFLETFPPKQNGRTRGTQLIGNGVIGSSITSPACKDIIVTVH
jgi:hypothetical protein